MKVKIPADANLRHLQNVHHMAIELMAENGLRGEWPWRFKWDRASVRAGQCTKMNKTISLSHAREQGACDCTPG